MEMMMSETLINSDQRKFDLPVDSEHKATKFRIFSIAAPHMRAFHLSWISFFSCFVSTFAVSPLLPIIRDNLNLTATDIGNSGISAVSGAVLARIAMGTACDLFGPLVGTANCVSGGWGNLGGGATQLITPLVFSLIRDIGATKFTARRIAFFIPALFQTLSAYAVFFLEQDLPDGNISGLQKSGYKQKDYFF
ncbi:unnamed protein product [Ilex paraguariensis]|uniref:Uncharacterized protein n=1 Tax=Ilex paraguariensis TaxID=185542 RepID=A0ABC8U093_9AQUA